MTLADFTRLRNEVDRTRQYNGDQDYITAIEHRDGKMEFSVRYFGSWEVPADAPADDREDYDWMVPTAETVKRLDALCARFTGARWSDDGEKCWVTFTAPEERTSASGPCGALWLVGDRFQSR